MKTAEVLESAGLTAAAANLRRHGLQWLHDHQATVKRVASAAGIDIDPAIAFDTTLQPPSGSPVVDVVMPFHAGDRRWLRKGVLALLRSRHVSPLLHVVADGCEFPELPDDDRIRRYVASQPAEWRQAGPTTAHRTVGTTHGCEQTNAGPYRIANSLVRWGHCQADWLAIQDADDISLPDRLWRQIAMLEKHGADMISSAARNFVDRHDTSEVAAAKIRWQKVVRPGRKYESVLKGHCVNPTRTMRREFFVRMNGFTDWMCSGDFEFDNRCRYTGQHIIDDQTILALRRLHGQSISHGLVPVNSPERRSLVSKIIARQTQLQANPSIELAQSFGALTTAEPLLSERASRSCLT